MRVRSAIVALIVALVATILGQATVSAASLKVMPLKYDVALAVGETKKGFVDIANTSTVSETVALSVQAFRQTDNNGSLAFYDDEAVKSGVLLDYSEAEIGPKEVLHLAFAVDSSKLPAGNVFAAIFASTKPDINSGAAQSVRVGSLLFITNGDGGEHLAAIEQVQVPFFQFGNGLSAHFALRGSDAAAGSGFFPKVEMTIWPYVHDTFTGPLVSQGITRQVDYVKRGSYFGLVKYTIKTPGSQSTVYSVVMTGYWRGIVPLGVILLTAAIVYLIYVRKHPHVHNRGSKTH